MSANGNTIERMSTVSRLLSYQRKNNVETADAISKIKNALPVDYSEDIDAVLMLVSGNRVTHGQESRLSGAMSKLAACVEKENASLEKLFLETQNQIKEAIITAKEFWSGFNSILTYVSSICIIAAIVLPIFIFKVAPVFSGFFSEMNSDLPEFTRFVFGNKEIFVGVIVLLLIVVIVSFISSLHIKRCISRFAALHPVCFYIPGVKTFSEIYAYHLFVHYVKALVNSGVKEEVSFQAAADLSGLKERRLSRFNTWYQAAKAATLINCLAEEVEFQSKNSIALVNTEVVRLRENMTIGIQVATGLLIGTVIIAMYLPIFSIGSVI